MSNINGFDLLKNAEGLLDNTILAVQSEALRIEDENYTYIPGSLTTLDTSSKDRVRTAATKASSVFRAADNYLSFRRENVERKFKKYMEANERLQTATTEMVQLTASSETTASLSESLQDTATMLTETLDEDYNYELGQYKEFSNDVLRIKTKAELVLKDLKGPNYLKIGGVVGGGLAAAAGFVAVVTKYVLPAAAAVGSAMTSYFVANSTGT